MSVLKEFVGRVIEVCPRFKAIVAFQINGNTERALLWYDKLKKNGETLPEGGSIDGYVRKDTQLRFLCHAFDGTGVDKCSWYITSACIIEENDRSAITNTDTIFTGLFNCVGSVHEIARRQGVILYSNKGKEEYVLFLGSKLWMGGKRVQSKAVLSSLGVLEEGSSVTFDAVPCDPLDPEAKHRWFATAVWKGRKPLMEYEDPRNVRKKPAASLPLLSEAKLAMGNPHSLFLRTVGQVMKIISPEYGIAIARVKNNHFDTVLFHRSHVMLFDMNLADQDLTTIFKEGDKVRVMAALAPKKMITRWVASQIQLYIDPSIRHSYPSSKVADKTTKRS